MKKFLNYIKKIHLIEYIIYTALYTVICIITTNIRVIHYVGLCIIAFVMMNTWKIEKKDKLGKKS